MATPTHFWRHILALSAIVLPATLIMAQDAPAPATAPATQPVAAPVDAPATQPATQPATAPTTMPATLPTTASSTQPVIPAIRPPKNGYKGITLKEGGGLMLNFKDASVDAILDELSSAAGFIVIKDFKPEGRVTLTSSQPVKIDEVVPLLNAVLKNAKATAIQQGRELRIVESTKAKKMNIPVRYGSDPAQIAATEELITQVMPLKYADAPQLKQDLTPLMNTDADFTANASSNTLVITDTSANIKRMAEIVNSLDKSLAGASDVRVFRLQYASAAAAAKLVTDIFAAEQNDPRAGRGNTGSPFQRFMGGGGFGGGGFGGGGFGGGGGRGGGGGAGGDGTGQGTRRNVRLVASADDRTNTLVVSGPSDIIPLVEKVVKDIDSDPAAEETVFVYRLKNAQAANVEQVMNNLFNGTGTGRSNYSTNRSGSNSSNLNRSGTNRNTGGSSGRSSGSGLGSSGSSRTGSSSGGFGASSGRSGFGSTGFGSTGGYGGYSGYGGMSSNASRTAQDLTGQVNVIADTDTNSLMIRTHPKNLDRVKAVLAELDRAVAQVLIKVLIAEVTHDNGSDIGAEFSILNMRASGNGQKGGTNFGLANASGGLVVSLLETNVTATLRALETAGKLDVLSRPYILASDNQLASITVGQEVPFITNTRFTDTGQTINTIEYSDIGILLDVLPHINPDGLVILDVAPEISALTGTTVPISETVSAPVFAKRSAQSRVAVRNGQTIVIGGLMEDRKTETIRKIPFLGDIPILGEIFKRRENSKTKTELLIFLTPHVAMQPEMLKDMATKELDGTKLVPGAVYPGAFEEHRSSMERGNTVGATRPAVELDIKEMPRQRPMREEPVVPETSPRPKEEDRPRGDDGRRPRFNYAQ